MVELCGFVSKPRLFSYPQRSTCGSYFLGLPVCSVCWRSWLPAAGRIFYLPIATRTQRVVPLLARFPRPVSQSSACVCPSTSPQKRDSRDCERRHAVAGDAVVGRMDGRTARSSSPGSNSLAHSDARGKPSRQLHCPICAARRLQRRQDRGTGRTLDTNSNTHSLTHSLTHAQQK